MTKDYYKILGVSELCTETELKSAYRKLARKWHPDIAGNTDDVVAKFKSINEAYEILSDKIKRAEYDTVKRCYNYAENKSSKKENTTNPNYKSTSNQNKKEQNNKKNSGFNFNWEEFLSKYREYTDNYRECNKRNNESKNNESNVKYGNSQKGKDINTDIEISIAEAVNGTTKIINMLNSNVCSYCNGRKFINGTTCPHC